MVRYVEKRYKTILNVSKFIDSWFWTKYGVNPYNGCEFACSYCDSRSHKYHLQPDFDRTIYIKKEAPNQLHLRLKRAKTLLPDVASFGSACDAYQPIEKEYEVSRRCLEVFRKHKFPVHIVTKSDLIVRDIDILKQIAKDSWSCVSITITLWDEEKRVVFEPNAPPTRKRFEALEKIKDAGIRAGVMFCPIIPFIGDDFENLEAMVSKARDVGADHVVFGGMTMRDAQALWFMRVLKMDYPILVEPMEELYQGGYTPVDDGYRQKQNDKMLELCSKYQMPFRIKRFIPEDFRKHNYLVAEVLQNIAYFYQLKGDMKKYNEYLWPGMHINNLKEGITKLAKRGVLKTIPNVTRPVSQTITEILEEGRCGEYDELMEGLAKPE